MTAKLFTLVALRARVVRGAGRETKMEPHTAVLLTMFGSGLAASGAMFGRTRDTRPIYYTRNQQATPVMRTPSINKATGIGHSLGNATVEREIVTWHGKRRVRLFAVR